MADVKWIKLSIGIFNNRKIKQIRKLPEGDAIIGIWLQILCLAGEINDNGMVYFSKDIPYTEEMLATEFDRPINIIKIALATFENFKMIEVFDNILLVSNWEKYQSTGRLEEIREQNRLRQQRFRNKQKQLADSNVTDNAKVTLRNATELDKELDKEIYKDIVEYLNQKAGTKYKHTTKATQRHINGRLAEGYTLDDFKAVINKKVAEWKDTDMAKYLRPETLFGTKFEGYLNQKEGKEPKPKSTNKFNQFPQRQYTPQQISEIERKLINKGLED